MILTSHAVVGAALSKVTSSIPGAFALGVISHYLTDAIPHYDYIEEDFVINPHSAKSKRMLWPIMLDGVTGLVVSFLLFPPQTYGDFLKVFFAVAGAMLPDAIQGIEAYFPNWLTAQCNKFHHRMHFLITRKQYLRNFPMLGLLLQAGIVAAFYYFLR